MSARQTRFVRPRNKTVEGLHAALITNLDILERLRQEEEDGDQADLGPLEERIAEAEGRVLSILATLADIATNGALTLQQAFELGLVTAVDTTLGSVPKGVLDSIKQSEKAALAVIESLLKGRKNEIAIRVEQAARLTDREAFVSQFSEFTAQIGLAQAQITEEIQARSDGDNALALVDQQITSALNGNVAAVQILTESVNGIEARWGVAINQNGQVTGLIQLDGEATGSTFTIVANNFRIAQPGSSGGGAVPVFAIQNVNGTTKLALRGDMLADGSIAARHISVVSLDAITGNIGTMRSGRLLSQNSKTDFNLNAGRLVMLGN